MNKYPYIILLLLFLACFCNRKDDEPQHKEKEPEPQESTQTTQKFVPKTGMELQSLAGMPGVKWDFDTITGVCAPDTLMLWVEYEGVDYPTNVYGVNGKFTNLSVSGEKKINLDSRYNEYIRTDFAPESKIISTFGLSRSEFNELKDTLSKYDAERLIELVKNFFLSKGETKYMSKLMAYNWTLIYSQIDDSGTNSTNPFNRSPKFNFDASSLKVTLTDVSKGVLEVAAYCTDPYTVGGSGWAYWTVRTCRENGNFKIKENPAQHRKFTY